MINFSTTPIATLVESIGYESMQTYVIVMIALVILMTIADLIHKGSTTYFFNAAAKAEKDLAAGNAVCTVGKEDTRLTQLSAGDKAGILVSTIVTDVATAGEFANPVRRLVHVLTMYGFILFNAATAMIIFGENAADATLAQVWNTGAIMLFIGTFWFWFSFKVDGQAEGVSWNSITLRKDMFSLSLMATSVTALGWSYVGGGEGIWFMLVILSTASLFGGVYWSKFSHMFFKPAAAYNKRIIKANGTNENLPHETRFGGKTAADDDFQQNRHSMELLKDAPMDMGLGIKREAPKHY
ncbi:Adenylylsulfate reductase membrane anchor [uncultured Gammaproteobacteria bacterium]|nr:Adenylylsulfate reductase membrane anchor [uncultured Gammaproteobacteria bacterium]CAC9950952.1 Adenylylsulfate reductase membrane anchor [uncultured Gammaproteobacteria bacterium]